MSSLTLQERSTLRRFLAERFSLAELKTLAFDLGISVDDLPGGTRTEFSRVLFEYCEQRERLGCLLVEVIRQRPDEGLAALLAKLEACVPRQKVQIILPQTLLPHPADLRAKIAAYLGISPDDVGVLATASGSLKVLLSLPAEAAQRLLADPPASLGRYRFLSTTFYEALPLAEQQAWRAAAWQQTMGLPRATPLPAPASVAPGWKLFLVGTLVVALVGTGVAVGTAPRLTLHNRCARTFPLGMTVPGLGSELPPGDRTLRLPPGTYQLTHTGDAIGLDSSFFTFTPVRFDVPVEIVIGDETLSPQPQPIERTVGFGTRVEVTLCGG